MRMQCSKFQWGCNGVVSLHVCLLCHIRYIYIYLLYEICCIIIYITLFICLYVGICLPTKDVGIDRSDGHRYRYR